MKNLLRAVLTFTLLMLSKGYRLRWGKTMDQVDASLDFVDASMRRIDALENGGRPKIRVV